MPLFQNELHFYRINTKGGYSLQKFIISLGLIFLGLVIGQSIKILADKKIIGDAIFIEKYIKIVQNLALLVLNPIVVVGAFWILKIEDVKLIIIPILGLSALVLGGVLGYLATRVMKLNKIQTGSLFVSSSFTNLGSFGALMCFVFFGEASYVFVSMYKIFEELYYYTIGYPIAKAHGITNQKERSIFKFVMDPYILVSVSSILLGIVLNNAGITRPMVYSSINNLLIPMISLLLVTTVGFKMRFTAVKDYIKESVVVSLIKFVIVPIVITTAAYIIGLGEISDGLPLKVVLVLSAMPPAFNSLIPPQIYGLDVDLANSSWLFNTGALVVVLPVLYYIQSFI